MLHILLHQHCRSCKDRPAPLARPQPHQGGDGSDDDGDDDDGPDGPQGPAVPWPGPGAPGAGPPPPPGGLHQPRVYGWPPSGATVLSNAHPRGLATFSWMFVPLLAHAMGQGHLHPAFPAHQPPFSGWVQHLQQALLAWQPPGGLQGHASLWDWAVAQPGGRWPGYVGANTQQLLLSGAVSVEALVIGQQAQTLATSIGIAMLGGAEGAAPIDAIVAAAAADYLDVAVAAAAVAGVAAGWGGQQGEGRGRPGPPVLPVPEWLAAALEAAWAAFHQQPGGP